MVLGCRMASQDIQSATRVRRHNSRRLRRKNLVLDSGCLLIVHGFMLHHEVTAMFLTKLKQVTEAIQRERNTLCFVGEHVAELG